MRYPDNAAKVERMCNYYNAEDFALTWGWELNNRWKPDDGWGYGFGYGGSISNYDFTESTPATNRFFRWWGYIESMSVTNNADLRTRYMVFSYCAESRSRALGQAENTAFAFINRNLKADPLNYNDAHYSHSKQLRSNIVDQLAYYQYLYSDCDF